MAPVKRCYPSLIVFSPITAISSVPLAHSQACNPAHYRGLPHLTAVETDFVC